MGNVSDDTLGNMAMSEIVEKLGFQIGTMVKARKKFDDEPATFMLL
jgi:hypothetical protein